LLVVRRRIEPLPTSWPLRKKSTPAVALPVAVLVTLASPRIVYPWPGLSLEVMSCARVAAWLSNRTMPSAPAVAAPAGVPRVRGQLASPLSNPGWATMPPAPDPGVAVNAAPPWNRTWSPAFRSTLFTRLMDCQAFWGDRPSAASLPDGLT
jgi:hypothetical protein